VSVGEGNAGSANASFSLTLSASSPQTVTVGYATADGTATAGSDYMAVSGTLSFAPGSTSVTIDVPILGDTAIELDETFFVNLNAVVNAVVADGQGRGRSPTTTCQRLDRRRQRGRELGRRTRASA
jgi:hypothetical protein